MEVAVIRTATEFKADMNEMAKIYKIAQTKNVYVRRKSLLGAIAHSYHRPRKINGVLVPHGYKFINGKIEHDGVAKDHDQSENVEKAPPKTPTKTTKKAPKTPKSKEPKAPKVNKKRKLDEEEEEEEEEAEDDDVGMAKGEDDEAVESRG